MKKILIIQTAFIGDAILATALLEKLHRCIPSAKLDLLVRQGNESLFSNHPYLHQLLVWNKRKDKIKNLAKTVLLIKQNKYDLVINLQRFFSSGLFTVLSGADITIGFDKNPLSWLFTKSVKHEIGTQKHEIERNQDLIAHLCDTFIDKPKLYPTLQDYQSVAVYQQMPYYCIAPNSVWYTKQFPAPKWIELINKMSIENNIFLLGAPGDFEACDYIKNNAIHKNVINLAGKLSFLQSAALMHGAAMNFVNDSAPMHIGSAMNAPVTAIFCSTVPNFGFGPLSDNSKNVETKEILSCRPCGLHGFKNCPKEHFKCASTIQIEQFLID